MPLVKRILAVLLLKHVHVCFKRSLIQLELLSQKLEASNGGLIKGVVPTLTGAGADQI